MNVLFYTPFNQRSRDTESLMEAFIKQGHHVYLLTQAEKGDYHEACEKLGVKTSGHVIKKSGAISYYLKHYSYLKSFCRKNNIHVVYAHLETAALPAVLSQYFIKAKVYACRHIINEAYLFNNKNFILLNKIVYKLAKHIIVVSLHAKDFMVENEKIKSSKIQVIRLAYNFNFYKKPDASEIAKIKTDFPSKLLLLTACRLLPAKRADYSIRIVKTLIAKGLDVSLMILGDGPELKNLQQLIINENLSTRVFLLGFKTNIVDYLTACDVLLHPSVLDSSSVIIKEAGLAGKTVLACKHIGDVDEYLIHGKNAYLVSEANAEDEMVEILAEIYNNKEQLPLMGTTLKEIVMKRFSIDAILPQYDEIHKALSLN